MIHEARVHARLPCDASIGLRESYADGWWDARALDVTIEKSLRGTR